VTGGDFFPAEVTMYSLPVGFSVTSIRRSGRKAIAQGLLKPDAISVTFSGVRVRIAGARVCPGNAGVNSLCPSARPAAASRTRMIAAVVGELRTWRHLRAGSPGELASRQADDAGDDPE
jgi:hypothetical protein